MVPKFLLVSLGPDIFRKESWRGLVAQVFPEYDLLDVGLYSVAIAKKTTLEQGDE